MGVNEVMSGRELNRAGQDGGAVQVFEAGAAARDALALYQAEPALALRVAPPLMAGVGQAVRGVVAGVYSAEHTEFGAYGVCVYEVLVDGIAGLYGVYAIPETIRGAYRALKPQRGDEHTLYYRGLRANKTGTREYHDYTIVDAGNVTVDEDVSW